MNYVKLFEAFVEASEEEKDKALKVADKVESWLKTLGVKYKRDESIRNNLPQFYIYSPLGGTWTFHYEEVRTKAAGIGKGRGFYGEYHETGKLAWFTTAPGSTLSKDRKRTNFSSFKEIFERFNKAQNYFLNVVEFLEMIGIEKDERTRIYVGSLAKNDELYFKYKTSGKLDVEVRSEKNKTVEESFCIWWHKEKSHLEYVDPSKGETLLLACQIADPENHKVIDFLKEREDHPIEKVLEEVKHLLRGKLAAKKFLG